MAAIRWDNVNAPTIDPSRGMYVTADLINNGFNSFNKVIQDQQKVETGNWDNQAKNNTNAYMDALAEAKTPEEFQSKQAFLAQMRQGFSAQVDQDATRKAEEGRLALLQGRATAEIGYRTALDNEADVAKAGLVTELMGKGEYTQAGEAIKTMSARGQAPWFQKLEAQQDKDTTQAQGNIRMEQDLLKAAREQDMHPYKLDQAKAELEATRARTAYDEAHAKQLLADPITKRVTAAIKQTDDQLKYIKENTVFDGSFDMNDTVRANNLGSAIKGSIGKGGEKAVDELTKQYSAKPFYTVRGEGGTTQDIPLPPAALKRAIEMSGSGAKDKVGGFIPFTGEQAYGDVFKQNVAENLDKIMHDPELLNTYTTYRSLHDDKAAYLSGTGPISNATGTGLPKPINTTQVSQAKPDAPTTKLEQEAVKTEASKPTTTSPDVNPQEVLKGVDPKVGSYWVNGERYKYQSTTDNDNQVVGNAWVRDTGAGGMFSSGNSKSRISNKYTGSDQGSTTSNEAILKKSLGVTSTPVEQSKTSAPTTYAGTIPTELGTEVTFKPMDADTGKFAAIDPNTTVPGAKGNVGRLSYIDANETAKPGLGKEGQPLGQEALDFLKEAAAGKKVTVRVVGQAARTDTDKTRNVIDMDIDGVPANLLLVKAGLARVDKRADHKIPAVAELLKAQNYAESHRLGVHSKNQRSNPHAEDHRRVQKESD